MPIKDTDLKPETRRRLGIQGHRKQRMTKDALSGHAIEVLNAITWLRAVDRARVLRLALRLNELR